MPLVGRKDIRAYAAEFTVIVLSVLIAFQVEEWRERRAERRDLDAAMSRLKEETEENLRLCKYWEPELRNTASDVYNVFRSLHTGHYANGDRDSFLRGLTRFDVVPDIRLYTSVANEMTATGLLMEVESEDLRRLIASLPAYENASSAILAYWRESIVELSSELMSEVAYSYKEEFEVDTEDFWKTEPESQMQVEYDLSSLANNLRLRNFFFAAVDVHDDLRSDLRRRCSRFEQMSELLGQDEKS